MQVFIGEQENFSCLPMILFSFFNEYLHWKNKVYKSLALGYPYCTFNLDYMHKTL